MSKQELTRDFLWNKYIVEGMTRKAIAELTGWAIPTIHKNLVKHDIKKQGNPDYHFTLSSKKVTKLDKETLYYEYIVLQKTALEIAQLRGMTKRGVIAKLKLYNIYIRSNKEFRKNLIGKQFGNLTVIKEVKSGQLYGKYTRNWLCNCKCGKQKVFGTTQLTSGQYTSCNCVRYLNKQRSSSWKGFGELSGTYVSGLKLRAENKGLDFDLTAEYLWGLFVKQNKRCALTNLELSMPETNVFNAASVDRIDSSKGYIKGNVWWVHKDINRMKWELSVEEFINMCKLVVANS